jgi:BlaI family penicillinase repressor
MSKKQDSIALAPAEWEIMKLLWNRGPAAARDVFAALPADNSWAYKTVKTLLSRLVAKGAITYEQVGNSYLYRPAVEQEQMTREEVRGLFRRIQGMALSPLLAHFIDEANLSDADIQELRHMLDNKRSSRPKRKGK